jgi:DNA processing protein
MKITEKNARINLACNFEITSRRFLFLLDKYKSAESILENIPLLTSSNFIQKKPVPCNLELLDPAGVLVYGEEGYPLNLANIDDPPIAIFFKGDIGAINFERTIAVVGTRKMSRYGIEVTTKLIRFLVERGYIIVSGLAYGIDALAHELTLSLGGQTIAVLGTSINEPYPQSNTALYNKIIKNRGLVISESFFKEEYGKWVFPKRNRIIAGLCSKTVVIEAPQKSGALITANFAFGYNRDVFAIPGPINSFNCMGSHLLIKNNKAQILTAFEDLVDPDWDKQGIGNIPGDPESQANREGPRNAEKPGHREKHNENSHKNGQLFLSTKPTDNHTNAAGGQFPMTEEFKYIYKLINDGINSFELLVEKCNYDINNLLKILSYLEIYDYIKKLEDGSFMVK